MKTKILLIAMLVLSLTLIIAACSPAAAPSDVGTSSGAPAAQGSSVDGKAILERTCTQCHSLDRITSASKTTDGWTSTVDRMIGKGAKLTDAEKTALIAYLSETYK
jgi:competence protein ComEA